MKRLIAILVVISLALVVAFSGILGKKEPRIIFQSARDAPLSDPDFQANPQKYFELYVMNADGSDIRRITENRYWENQADVSPDGKKIVCSIHYSPGKVSETDPGWEIAVIDINGKNLRKLTDNNYLDFGAHWNHDGTKIVYVSDSARRTTQDIEKGLLPQYDIYTMDADGGNIQQLTFASPGEVYADPSFSFTEPSRILYVHSKGLSSNFDLFMMDADGGNKKLVLEHNDELLKINDPMFSPDGNRIIFEALVRESDPYGNPIYNLFTVDVSGEGLTRITQDDGETDVLPQFSPDGSKICYCTHVWTEDGRNHTYRIRVANTDGTDEKVVSDFPWEAAPSWVPK